MNKYKGALKGIYKPKNPRKWIGAKIIFRSNLERKFFNLFDLNPNVISIASERIIVPYFDPVKNKPRNYYTDLIVKYKDKQGEVKIKLIEIKCSGEAREPKKPKRITERYKSSVLTWLTNKSKWEAATKYANSRGWEFIVLSEKNL
jgi:hypothetical protein